MRNPIHRAELLGALLLASTLAHAQFAWIDEKGVRHYSDQPPPTNTPAAKILKTPRGMAPSTETSPAPASTLPVKAPPNLAEREADYAKRKQQATDSVTKAAADKQVADAKQARCTTAANNKAQLGSGQRVLTDKNVAMSDAEKARELVSANAILKDCQ
ncbi:MAG: DUF4124 domain-containing protein [Pseudomonadota bacterium]|nr:DUF4124 domain-containing protein [Pseudomonadota bacterium]